MYVFIDAKLRIRLESLTDRFCSMIRIRTIYALTESSMQMTLKYTHQANHPPEATELFGIFALFAIALRAHILYIMSNVDRLLWAALFIAARCLRFDTHTHAYYVVALQTYAIAVVVVVVAQTIHFVCSTFFEWLCCYYYYCCAIHSKSKNNNNAIVCKGLQRQFFHWCIEIRWKY